MQAAHRLRLHRPNGRRRVRLILGTALPVAALPPTALVRDTTGGARVAATTAKLAAALDGVVATQGYASQADVAQAAAVQRSQVTPHWATILERTGYTTEQRRVRTGATTRTLTVAIGLAPGSDAPPSRAALLRGG